MKRLWIGIGILFVLLVLGIITTCFAIGIHEEISEKLQLASNAALGGQWEQAQLLSCQAKEQWETYHQWIAAISDHEPMEEIDDLFAQLDIYLQTGQPLPFSVCCASLSVMTHAVGESHAINWWSLL